jgi:hypothetical protein
MSRKPQEPLGARPFALSALQSDRTRLRRQHTLSFRIRLASLEALPLA